MEVKEKELIESTIGILKRTIFKEKQLTDVFREPSYVYSETIEALEQALFKRLDLEYGYDGSDDGNHKDGLFSFVIDETMTIWELLDFKE